MHEVLVVFREYFYKNAPVAGGVEGLDWQAWEEEIFPQLPLLELEVVAATREAGLDERCLRHETAAVELQVYCGRGTLIPPLHPLYRLRQKLKIQVCFRSSTRRIRNRWIPMDLPLPMPDEPLDLQQWTMMRWTSFGALLK